MRHFLVFFIRNLRFVNFGFSDLKRKELVAFEGKWFWRFDSNGNYHGYPKLIEDHWEGLKSNVDAAAYSRYTGFSYIFRGTLIFFNLQSLIFMTSQEAKFIDFATTNQIKTSRDLYPLLDCPTMWTQPCSGQVTDLCMCSNVSVVQPTKHVTNYVVARQQLFPLQ